MKQKIIRLFIWLFVIIGFTFVFYTGYLEFFSEPEKSNEQVNDKIKVNIGEFILFQNAFAQVEETIPEVTDQTVPCEEIRIGGSQAWTPFTLRVKHPYTTDFVISKPPAEAGSERPKTNINRDETGMTFYTNDTNRYVFDYSLKYPTSENIGAYLTTIETQGVVTYNGIENINQKSFCKRYIITTSIAPTFPSLEQYLTDAGLKAVKEFEFIVPALLDVNSTLGRLMWLQIVVLGIIIILIIYDKKQTWDESKERKIRDKKSAAIIKKADDTIEATIELKEEIKKIIPGFGKRIDDAVDKMKIEQNMILLDNKRIIEQFFKKIDTVIPGLKEQIKSQPIEQPVKEEPKTIINKIQDIASKFTSEKIGNRDVSIDEVIDEKILEEIYKNNDYEYNQKLFKKYKNKAKDYEDNPEKKSTSIKRSNLLSKVLNLQYNGAKNDTQ